MFTEVLMLEQTEHARPCSKVPILARYRVQCGTW